MPELLEIIIITIIICTLSTLFSALLGLPAGIALGMAKNRLRSLRSLCTTFVGLPPVLAGLVVYMLLRNGGLFSGLKILFTPAAIIFAQILIILPTIIVSVFPAVQQKGADITLTLNGLQIKGVQKYLILLREYRPVLVTAVLTGFGRAISEVGAVMIVGGNILHKTRVMTTAIVLETSKGNFEQAFELGAVLLFISFAVNFTARRLAYDHI